MGVISSGIQWMFILGLSFVIASFIPSFLIPSWVRCDSQGLELKTLTQIAIGAWSLLVHKNNAQLLSIIALGLVLAPTLVSEKLDVYNLQRLALQATNSQNSLSLGHQLFCSYDTMWESVKPFLPLGVRIDIWHLIFPLLMAIGKSVKAAHYVGPIGVLYSLFDVILALVGAICFGSMRFVPAIFIPFIIIGAFIIRDMLKPKGEKIASGIRISKQSIKSHYKSFFNLVSLLVALGLLWTGFLSFTAFMLVFTMNLWVFGQRFMMETAFVACLLAFESHWLSMAVSLGAYMMLKSISSTLMWTLNVGSVVCVYSLLMGVVRPMVLGLFPASMMTYAEMLPDRWYSAINHPITSWGMHILVIIIISSVIHRLQRVVLRVIGKITALIIGSVGVFVFGLAPLLRIIANSNLLRSIVGGTVMRFINHAGSHGLATISMKEFAVYNFPLSRIKPLFAPEQVVLLICLFLGRLLIEGMLFSGGNSKGLLSVESDKDTNENSDDDDGDEYFIGSDELMDEDIFANLAPRKIETSSGPVNAAPPSTSNFPNPTKIAPVPQKPVTLPVVERESVASAPMLPPNTPAPSPVIAHSQIFPSAPPTACLQQVTERFNPSMVKPSAPPLTSTNVGTWNRPPITAQIFGVPPTGSVFSQMPIAHQQLSAYSSTTTNPSLPQTPTSFPIQPSTPSFPTSTAADSEPSAPEMGADQRRALETARNTQANRNLSEIKKARPSVSISVATSGDSGTINPTMRHSVGSIDTSVDSRGRTKRTPSVKDDDWWKSRHSSTSNIRSRSSRPLSRKRSRQHMYNDDDDESINEDKRLTQTFSYSSLMPNRRPTGNC
eukprot:TRINITY_DN131916_c0_g1_i2.p1 TRINITY_DN131916_c0_g1~~TRINITY_DN131916_c0_g1_i2.p1  ORF type:complete len:834 (-),score=204.64 TRINITY_DN131916_c0_g1_i2:80-2581(-)